MDAAPNGVGPHKAVGKMEGSTSSVGVGGGSIAGLDALRSFGSAALSQLTSSVSTNASMSPQIESMREHATSIWAAARPWTEFCNTKKFIPASNLGEVQQRLLDNLQYFSANYILIFVGLSALGVLVHPMSFVCVLAVLAVYIYAFLQHPGSLKLGPIVLHLQAKRISFALFTFIVLYLTNAVAILGSWALFSIILSIVHAGARISVKEPDFETAVDV